jgi:hypothetical protein
MSMFVNDNTIGFENPLNAQYICVYNITFIDITKSELPKHYKDSFLLAYSFEDLQEAIKNDVKGFFLAHEKFMIDIDYSYNIVYSGKIGEFKPTKLTFETIYPLEVQLFDRIKINTITDNNNKSKNSSNN